MKRGLLLMKRTKRKHISSLMAMILFAGTVTISSVPTETALAATDTYGHWAESTINKWTASGYITGYPDGTFRPNNAISRAEFVTLANKAFGYNVPTSITFSDVNSSYWAYNEIQKGVSAGYIRGDAAGTFRPGAAVTRQEAAVMMSQIKKLQQDNNRAMNYTDYDSISNWAKPYVGAVSSVKIMQGFPNGAFRPQTSMTRAEAVTALENAIFAAPQVPSSSTTINPNPDTSVNNSPGSSFNSSTNSSSSSSSRPTDSEYTLEETTLRNRIISGDLIISDSLDGKTVTLMNVTVNGTVKVQGGSTIRVQSCDFNNVELDRSNVIFNSDSKSKIKSLTFLEKGKIEGTGYENVYVEDDSLSEATIDATVNYLELDTDANLKLYKNADVSTLEITSDAKDGEVTFSSGAKVDDMSIRGKIRISGRGDINDMTTYVSGIRSSIRPDKLTTRGDGEKPSYTSGENGGSSSSSGSNYDDLTLDREDRRYDADGERYHNVTIEADGVEFRDATVYNRLTITRDVEDGEVIIEDVKVRGDVYIYGGGKNSVIFRDCDIQGDIISDKDIDSRYGEEPVALEFEDGTEVGDIRVRGETIIRAENGIKINTVTVDRILEEELELDAAISTLNIYSDCDVRILGRSKINKVEVSSGRDVTFRMESGSRIDTLDSKSDVVLRGNGTVKTIKTDKTISKDSGIVNDDQTSTFVAVTDILGIPTTGTTGTPLTLSPIVVPAGASYQTVKWTTDSGSIADDKILTVQKDGTVHLTATIENGKEIGTAFTKNFTIVFSSGGGSDTPNPPAPTEKGSVTGITSAADSVAQGGSLELTATGSHLSGKTINWSISGNSNGTSLSSTVGEKVTLNVATTQSTTGKITVKAWVKDDQAEANAAIKEITVTANSNPPAPNKAAVKGIQASTEQTAATTTIPVVQGNRVTLKATGENLEATGKTVNWKVEGTNLKTGTGFQKIDGTNTTINKTATGTETILVIAADETTGTENITIKAWASDQTETDAIIRKITVQQAPTTVTNVEITGMTQGNVTPNINAAKTGDKFQATATLNHDLQPNETVKWSFEGDVPESVAEVDPKIENNVTDTRVAIISINAQAASEQELTLQAQVVKGETSISDVMEVPQKIKIAANGSSSESATAVTEIEIEIEGIGNSVLTNDCAMKGGQFKATATLNRELQDGESVDWSLEGNNISALATITSDENNTKEAMIEIKEQSTQEVPFIVKAQIKKGETIIANSAKTEKMYIAGAAETIGIGIDASTPVIIHSDETINLTVGETLKVIARVSPENGDKTAKIVLESSDTSKFTVDKISETNTFTLTPKAVGTATLTAKVDAIEVTRNVEVKSVPVSRNEELQAEELAQDEEQEPATTMTTENSVRRAPAVPTIQEQPEEKPYVIDITLPTLEGEVGKDFDLSQANMEATGDFEIDWIVGRGFAETPDDHTVRMDRAGSVIMTAVVVGGQPNGDVYTKDFEITFVESKVETPVTPEEPKEETPVTPEEPKEETPVVPEEPKEETPVVPEEPKEETPVIPEEPKEETPVVPIQPEDENIVISTKGNLVVNNEITLFAKNKMGVDYTNTVWSIVDDGGTGAVLMTEIPAEEVAESVTTELSDDTEKTDDAKVSAKNVFVVKKPGTITIKVTVGNDSTKIRTKKIIIK